MHKCLDNNFFLFAMLMKSKKHSIVRLVSIYFSLHFKFTFILCGCLKFISYSVLIVLTIAFIYKQKLAILKCSLCIKSTNQSHLNLFKHST